MEKESVSLFGVRITWRRVMQVFCTIFLIILCSQLTTMLNFKAVNVVSKKSQQELEQEKKEYFDGLVEELNDLFDSLNYTIFEYVSYYRGQGLQLSTSYYVLPSAEVPFYKYYMMNHPVADLRENWIIIGRMVSFNGRLRFTPGKLAFNGKELKRIIEPNMGRFSGKKIINQESNVPMESFLQSLILGAHDRYLSREEQLYLSGKNKRLLATKFENALIESLKSRSRSDCEEAARIFNNYAKYLVIGSLYTAKVLENEKEKYYKVIFGKNTYSEYPVKDGVNQTSAYQDDFVETITFNSAIKRFKVIEGFTDLNRRERAYKDVFELFKFLEKSSRIRWNQATSIDNMVMSLSNKDDHITNIITPNDWFDPGDGGGGPPPPPPPGGSPPPDDPPENEDFWGLSMGNANEKNYGAWVDDLLAVAVIYNDKRPCHLDNLIGEAFEEDCFAYLDRFTFDYWAELLLEPNGAYGDMDIRYYDVIFISDVIVDEGVYDWETAWELTPRQKQVLSEWIYSGGSIYFSSAISNEESLVKNRFYPSDWISMRTSNKIASAQFDIGMPYLEKESILVDTCEVSGGSWYTAINEQNETWNWARYQDDSYYTGSRTGGVMTFGPTQQVHTGMSMAITASNEVFEIKGEESIYVETRLAPRFFSPITDQGVGDKWFFSVRIASNKWAQIQYLDEENRFTMGIASESIFGGDWYGDLYHSTGTINVERNGWHTLRFNIQHQANDISTIQFIINGFIEYSLDIHPNDQYGFETNPDLISTTIGLYSKARNSGIAGKSDHLLLGVNYLKTGFYDIAYDYTWNSDTDTPSSAHSGFGEFAITCDDDGLLPDSLTLGIKTKKEDDNWYMDSSETDFSLKVSQSLQVPSTYAKAYFTLDYKKHTNLESDVFEILILDDEENLLYQEKINRDQLITSEWESVDKIDLTTTLRGYAGRTIKLVLWVHGSETCIRDGTETDFVDTHALFSCDNIFLSFIGSKKEIPVYIYYDPIITDTLGTTEYGSSDISEPYNNVDPYRTFYFAETLKSKLLQEGISNTHLVDTDQLLDIIELEIPSVVINSHPFAEAIYDGTLTAPLISWIKNGGVLIETLEEPLSYYISDTNQLKRVPQADVAILGYDLFRSIYEYDSNPQHSLFSENFDDGLTDFDISNESITKIELSNFVGGWLDVVFDDENQNPDFILLEQTFESPLIIHQNPEYESIFFHADMYLENTTQVIIEGKSTDNKDLTLICVLGENIDSYGNEDNTTYYTSIPFNSFDTPSELDRYSWNSITINLDITAKMSSLAVFDSVTKLTINCTDNSKLDSIWIGTSGSSIQNPTDWIVSSLDYFTSDYPASQSVLEEMKRDIPGFVYAIYGQNSGVRELLFREDFIPIICPNDDLWCDKIADWTISDGGMLNYSTSIVYNGDISLEVNLTGQSDIILTKNIFDFNAYPYSFLVFSLSSNSSLNANAWFNDKEPILQLVDVNNENLSFSLSSIYDHNWKTVRLILEDGIKTSNFNQSQLSSIQIIFPKNCTENLLLFIDNLYFESSLDRGVWEWQGFLPILKNLIEIDAFDDEIVLMTKDKFGLGTIEFQAQFDPLSDIEMGLIYNDVSKVTFRYLSDVLEWWNSSWSHRQEVIIMNSGDELSDYPVKVLLDDTDAYEKMQETGNDLRFIDESKEELEYFVEEWDIQGISCIWVKIPIINANRKTHFYMYFGNSTVSSGAVTPFETPNEDYTDYFTTDLWVHNKPSYIFVDTTNERMDIKTRRSWTDDWSYSDVNIPENFIYKFRYNTRDKYSCGILAYGLSSTNTGTLYDSSLTDGLFLYHYGGSSSTNNRPYFRMVRKINGAIGYSTLDLTWQPDDHTWYIIKIIKNDESALLEIWTNDESTLLQTHSLNVAGIDQMNYLYACGRYTNPGYNYQNAYVDYVQLSDFDSSDTISVRIHSMEKQGITSHKSWWNANWFDDDWLYRKEILIEVADDITNNAFILDITDQEIYDKALADGADLRFIDKDGNVLSHWIQSWYPYATSKIVVKLPQMQVDEDTSIYIYYGNYLASSTSNGDNTFLFFDDFSGSTMKHLNWQEDAANNIDHEILDYFEFVDATKDEDTYMVYNPSDTGSQHQAITELPEYNFVIEWQQDVHYESLEEMGQGGIGLVNNLGKVVVYLSHHDDSTSSGVNIFGFIGQTSTSIAVNNDDVRDFRITVHDGYVRLWHKLQSEEWSSVSPILMDGIDATTINGFALVAGAKGDEILNPYLDYIRIRDLRVYNYYSCFTDVEFLLEEELEKNAFHHTFDLSVIVDDGTTIQEHDIDFEGGFNPTIPHVYKIIREDNDPRISFYIDNQLIYEFTTNLPVYEPPQHAIQFLVNKGDMILHWLKYAEHSPTLDIQYNSIGYGYGTSLSDEFVYRDDFPRDEGDINDEDWWYVSGYNNDRIYNRLTNYPENSWDDVLYFEYDGDTGNPTAYEWKREIIERRFEPLTDFTMSADVDWWQESSSGARSFYTYLFNVDENEQYTFIGYVALIDAWTYYNGKYYVNSGDSAVILNAPLSGPSGGVVFEIIRSGSEVTTQILSSDRSSTILSSTYTQGETLPVNCIRLYYYGHFGSDMTPSYYSPSHSKVWVDSLEISGIGNNLPITSSGSYKIQGETYLDPLVISYGDGWMGFVKNTPIKPLTIDFVEEFDITAEWISYIIDDYFVQRIIPQCDFYWQMLPQGQSTERLMYASNNELGLKSLNNLHQVNSISANIESTIPNYLLNNFIPNLAFVPEHVFIDTLNAFNELSSDGFIRDWMVNVIENQGVHNFYPEYGDINKAKDIMMIGSTLFHTTFDSNHWNYDSNMDIQWEDFGSIADWSDGSGLSFDSYLQSSVLQVLEKSLIPDPNFESINSFWNETSPHYMFIDDADSLTNSTLSDYRCNLDGSGWPGPSVYFFNPNTTQNTFRFGARFNLSNIDFSIDQFFLEFDYWVTKANHTTGFGPFDIQSHVYELKSGHNWINPLDSIDRDNHYTLTDTQTLSLYSDFTEFSHFTYDYSNVLNGLDRSKNYLLEFEILFDGNTSFINKQNQTLYLDSFTLTPISINGAEGKNTGFGIKMNPVTFDWHSSFDQNEIGLVINYPYVVLGNVLTTDFIYEGCDYEFIITVYDPINEYTINLHYCWSDDDELLGGYEDKEYIIDNNIIDFYIHCKDQELNPLPQNLYLNVLYSLNELVKESKIKLAREQIIHKLGLQLGLDNNATNIQIDSLSIQGVAPWRRFTIDEVQDKFSTTDIFGDITGKSELVILADSFIWSTERRICELRISANTEASVYINDQIITSYQTSLAPLHNSTRSPQGKVILNAGLNKIEVRMANTPNGAEFKLWLLNEDFPLDIDNDQITQDDIPNNGLQISTVGNSFFDYPLVSAGFGRGRITFCSYDFDSIGGTEHSPDEPLVQLLSNIGNYEFQFRNYFSGQIMNRFIDLVEWKGIWSHTDAPYDSWNSDDKFKGITDDLEILRLNEGIARTIVNNFPRVLAAARERGNYGINYNELLERLEDFFTDADLTGNSEGWFTRDLLYIQENIYNANETAIEFQDFKKENTIYTYVENLNVQGASRHKYGFVRGYLEDDENSDSIVRIKLSHAFRRVKYRFGEWFDGAILESPEINDAYGIYSIYNHTHVWVDNEIIDDKGVVYLQESAAGNGYYSLLEVLNATAFCLYELSTYGSETNKEPMMTDFQNMLSSASSFRLFGMDMTKGLHDYIQGIQLNLFDIGRQECYDYLMRKEFEYLIDMGREDPQRALGILGLESEYNDELELVLDIDVCSPEDIINKTRIIVPSFVVPFTGLILLANFIGMRTTNSKPSGEKQYHYNFQKNWFTKWNDPNIDWSSPQIEEFFKYLEQRTDSSGQIISIWKNRYAKVSESFTSYNQLFQALHYIDTITISTAVLINSIVAINANAERLEAVPDILFADTYLTTKINHVLIPLGYRDPNNKIVNQGSKGSLVGAWKAFHSEYEGVRWLPSQSVIDTGICETLQVQNLYGVPIKKLLESVTGQTGDTSYAMPTIDMDLRIDRKQFNRLLNEIFTFNSNPEDKSFLENAYDKVKISQDDTFEYYQLKTFDIGLTTFQDIIFRKSRTSEEYEIVSIIKGGENRFIRTGDHTYELHGMYILYGNELSDATVEIDGETLTADQLWARGYGCIEFFGTKEVDGQTKKCFIFTKGEAFCLLKGLASNSVPLTRHLKLNRNDGTFDVNDGLITEQPNERSVFIDFERITGVVHSIESASEDSVVANYRPSFDWFLDYYINMLRVEFFLTTKSQNREEFSLTDNSKILFQFLNLLAYPITVKLLSSGEYDSVTDTIEVAKYRMLKGTGLLLEDIVPGVIPIADMKDGKLVFLTTEQTHRVSAQDSGPQIWMAHELLGPITDGSMNENWVQQDSEEIKTSHEPFRKILENMKTLAPDINWNNILYNKDNPEIAQVFLALLNKRNNRLLELKEKLESLPEDEQSPIDLDGLLMEIFSFPASVSFDKIGTLGEIAIIQNTLIDPYHLQKILIHNLVGIQGIDFDRDWRELKTWEMIDDEWQQVTQGEQYLPLKGAYLFFAYMERYFKALEKNPEGKVIEPFDYLANIYALDSESEIALLPHQYVTRFPTKATVNGETQVVPIHINLATQSGIRLLLEFFSQLTLLTQNSQSSEYEYWLELLEAIGLYQYLNKMLSSNEEDFVESIRISDTIWDEFGDSTRQKTSQNVKYHPAIQQIFMGFLGMNDWLSQTGMENSDFYDFINGIAGGLLAKELNVPNTDLTIIDLLSAMIIHYDTKTQEFYKLIDYQQLEQDGSLPEGQEIIWGTDRKRLEADDILYDQTWNDLVDPLLKGEKPYTKSGDTVNPFLSKLPVFKQYDSQGNWDSETGRYTVYILALNGKETHKTIGVHMEKPSKTEQLHTPMEMDIHDTYDMTPDEFNQYLIKELKIDESFVNRIDTVIIDFEALNCPDKLLNKIYQETKDKTNDQKDKSVFEKAYQTVDYFFENTIWFDTYWQSFKTSLPVKALGRLRAWGRAVRIGTSALDRKENKEIYFQKMQDKLLSFLSQIGTTENKKQQEIGTDYAKEIQNKIDMYKRGEISKELLEKDIAKIIMNPESVGLKDHPKLTDPPTNQKDPKSKSRDTHDGSIKKSKFRRLGFFMLGAGITITVGFGTNLLMQGGLYHVIGCIMQTRYSEVVFDNLNTMCDLNNDGKYDQPGEKGMYTNAYDVTSTASNVKAYNNLTRYQQALKYAGLVWFTDYMELGGEFWEAINGYLAGEQLGHIACGMPMVFAEDTESLAEAFSMLYDMHGKEPPEDLLQWIASPSFQKKWQWILLCLGAGISAAGEMINGAFTGFLAGGPWTAIGSAFIGYFQGLIGVFQSFAAGIVADDMWQTGMSTSASYVWKGHVMYHWTWTMKGDRDGLILLFNTLRWLHDAGTSVSPYCMRWMYARTYFDLGPWAGPFDSMMPLYAWFTYCFGFLWPVMCFVPSAIGKGAAFLVALLVAAVGTLVYMFFWGVGIRLLERWGLLPDKFLPPDKQGDY